MADNIVMQNAQGVPQYPKTKSDCVFDPVSGIPIKTQIDKMSKDIAELKEGGVSINSEYLQVNNTISAGNGDICFYTRISSGCKYQISVDISGDYSRMGVTTKIPKVGVDVLGYQAGGTGTKNYTAYIAMNGQGKTVNLNRNTESSFVVNPTDDFYLVVSVKEAYFNNIDIKYVKDEDEGEDNSKTGYLSIEKQLDNIKFMRTKFNATTLLWITDAHAIHADRRWTPQLEKALKFARDNDSYIDDILHTGDIVKNVESDWKADTWVELGAERVLNALGNHDVNKEGGGTLTSAESYTKYFAPYISNWGVVHDGDTSHCFYYKDYGDIRLIVLDQLAGSSVASAQATWLQNVLADARTNSKHVVVAGHYQPETDSSNPVSEKIPCSFTSTKNNFGYRSSGSFLDALDDFIEAGGNFVCWLVGHTHTDFITKIPTHNNQLVICQDCLACRIDTTADRNREVNKDSELCMNVISFNSLAKTITISRVGFEYDMYNRHRGSICIDYDSGEIVGEW